MSPSVSWSEIRRLFTMTFVLDRELRTFEVSEGLRRHCPKVMDGARFYEVFSVHRPQGVSGFYDLMQSLDTLVLLIALDNTFALRGQFIKDANNDDQLLFVGSPWLPWIMAQAPEVRLGLSDFPRHDPQMDAAFYEATQKAMFKDLQGVNEELRQAKIAAESAQRTQSDFLAVMSHEMRTPLNGIVTALSLNRDSSSKREQRDLLKVAYSSANNLMSLINYVLDFSKLQAGSFELEQEEFDLHETVSSIADILMAKAKAKNLQFSVGIDSEVPRFVRGDGSKLRQILINLASNAVKFTTVGSVSINVSSTYIDEKYEQYLFVVEDTGPGIPKEDQDRMFDAFWTAGSSSVSGEVSTGLGLNICKRLTELMGGSINYRSVLAKGSQFAFDVRFERIAKTKRPDSTSDLSQRFSGEILLVDDNQTNLFVGSMMLERMGVNVRTASDGREALKLVSSTQFDLVLMDITMPMMGGEEASGLIRGHGIDVPIVALTAHVGDNLLEQYKASGMQDVVHKPINKAELIRCLSRYLPKQTLPEVNHDQANAKQPVDKQALGSLVYNIGRENFAAASALFEKEMDSRVNSINSAWVNRDLPVLAKEAHTLKSSAASFGVLKFSAQIADLEEASRRNDYNSLIDLMPRLSENYKGALAAYQGEVARLSEKSKPSPTDFFA